MKHRFFLLLTATIGIMMALGLNGCTHRGVSPPVIMTQRSLQSDSLVGSLLRMLVSERSELRRDSLVRFERYTEKTTVNERGDTVRNDTHTEISTMEYKALESENRLLLKEIDSLRKVRNRVDTVPKPYEVKVPYPTERSITMWEKIRLTTWWWIAAALGGLLVWFRWDHLIRWIKR